MSRLQKALEALAPVQYSSVPLDNLALYLRDTFTQAELIINSVPPPPGGDEFSKSQRSRTDPNGATKASELTSSNARPPLLPDDIQELQKGWGKPMKLSAKDNPLGVSVFKMAGHDRHGAWFARRSVHEGLGFAKWKNAMQREFPESLEDQSGPGGGSIRGIGGDRRLERQDAEGTGRLEVYQLSAKFPPPTSPRDFVTLLLTSDNALSSASAVATDAGQGPKVIPRHWVVVSIPVDHPDAPPRQGLVRGQYESVEIIREIPLSPAKTRSQTDLLDKARDTEKSPGRQRGSTIGFAESRGKDAKGEFVDRQEPGDDPELNPVEWIMVTRSDPGGGIPRFLVDRGTPPSISADAVKFLDWACAREDYEWEEDAMHDVEPSPHEEERRPSYSSMNQRLVAGLNKDMDRSAIIPQDSTEDVTENGILSQATNALGVGAHALEQGIRSYTPDVVQQQLPGVFPKEEAVDDDESDDDSTATSSVDSFASAKLFHTAEDGNHDREQTPVGGRLGPEGASTSSLSNKSLESTSSKPSERTELSATEKELAKIDAKKKHLNDKLAASREKQEKEAQRAAAKSAEEEQKQRSRHEREMRKQEDRHAKEMRKLEERAQKEARKIEARKRKEEEKDVLLKAQKERDEFKLRVEVVEEENKVLREQLGELQKENTMLVAKMGRIDYGPSALKQVREEIAQEKNGKKRGTSVGSVGSVGSKDGGARGRQVEREHPNDSSELVGGQV